MSRQINAYHNGMSVGTMKKQSKPLHPDLPNRMRRYFSGQLECLRCYSHIDDNQMLRVDCQL